MKRMIHIVRMYLNLLRIASNPNNTDAALNICEQLEALGLLAAENEMIMSDPDSAQFTRRRKLMGQIDLHELQLLPEGSLGKAYSTHMLSLGLNPEFFKVLKVVDDITFGMMSLRQTHDLWHVMTGFDTSVPGELGLQAFMGAQTNSPLPPMLIGGRLFLSVIKNPSEISLVFDNVARGWLLGKKAKRLFPIDWENNWETPLADLRREYLGEDRFSANFLASEKSLDAN